VKEASSAKETLSDAVALTIKKVLNNIDCNMGGQSINKPEFRKPPT
jgi:hypothetical protein